MVRMLSALLIVIMSGCASMADSMNALSGVGRVTKEVSDFDGATIVRMEPAFLYDGKSSLMAMATKAGAYWNSQSPDRVSLILQNNSSAGYGNSYLSFKSIDVNIDGEKHSYPVDGATKFDNSGYNTVSRTIHTESRNAVTMDLGTLQKMVSAEDCRIRINTGDGYEVAYFHIDRMPGGQSTAIQHYKEFLAKVAAVKGQ